MYSDEKILSLITNRFLELIILPTEQCNFRCVYCYEDFTIGKMKPSTVTAIKKLITRRVAQLDALKISWFGGEPLAAKDIVFEISEFILNLKQSYPNLNYISGMTTNAFMLNDKIFARLIHLGINHFQISLDGTQVMHNQTRIRMNGGATFSTIWKNLVAARDSDFEFTIVIRIHLTPTNLEDIYSLVDQLKANFAHDKRFVVFFKAIENLGGPNSDSFTVLRGQNKTEITQQFNTYLNGVLSSQKLTRAGPYVCYAAQTNSFVIRANGRVGKCTVAFHDERNSLGYLADDGTITIDPDKLALWTRGIKTLNPADLHCPANKLPPLVTSFKNINVVVKNDN